MQLLPVLLLVAMVGGAQDPLPPEFQPGRGPGQRPQGGPPPADVGPNMTPAEIQKIFDAYLIVQAQEALGLTETQFAQFLGRLRVLQDARRRYQQDRMRILNELQRLTNPRNPNPGDEPTLRERLKALQDLEMRGPAEIGKAYAALDELLDPRQQARFRVFEEQLERKKLDLLLRARQNPNRGNRPPG